MDVHVGKQWYGVKHPMHLSQETANWNLEVTIVWREASYAFD
jgi:hypothetical protein